MAFDIEGARKAGYSDDDIADYLGQESGIDTQKARAAGYTSRELLAELSSAWAKKDLPAGVNPSKAGGGRGSVNPTDADQTTRGVLMAVEGESPTAPVSQPAGLSSAPRRGTMRAVTPYGAGDARVNAPRRGDSVLDRVDAAAMPDQGLTPQQMDAGSVAPWKQEQDAAIGRYRTGAGAPVAKPGDPMLDLSGQAGRAVAGATGSQRLGSLAEGAVDTYALAPEALAATTKLGVDIANLATLGAAQPVSDWLAQTINVINGAKSDRFQEGRRAFAEVMQNPDAGVLDVAAFMAANPRFSVEIGAPSIPSMLLGAGGARLGAALLAGRGAAATGAKIGAGAANVAMNAGSTFSDTNGDLGQKLLAAGAAGAGTALLGRMDGAETALATGRATGRAGAALRTGVNEGLQESGESLSQSLGQGTAEGNFDLNQSLKQAATEGVIGGFMGAGAGAASPEAQPAQPRQMSAEQLARSKGFLRPAQARTEAIARLDDLAAEHGIPSVVTEKLKKAADGKPLADLSGWFKRTLTALGQRGAIRPLDDAALSILDEQPDAPPQGQQEGTADTPAPGQREAAPQALDAASLLAGEDAAGYAGAPTPPGSEIGDINPNNPPAPQPATSGDAQHEKQAQKLGLQLGGAGWTKPVSDLGDVVVEFTNKPGEPMRANVSADYMGKRLDTRTAEGEPAIREAMDRAEAGIQKGRTQAARKMMADEGLADAAVPTIDAAAHEAAPSPNNDRAEPTDAQKEAGNYKKGHDSINGLGISFENPAGSVRRGTDRDGKAWENTLQHHYGYFKGTVGNDKDHVDVFVKPETPRDYAGPVFVVDQVHPDTGKFDEHKVLLGFSDIEEAKAAYRSNYAKGWKGLKSISAMPFDEFKAWVHDGPKNKPLVPIVKPPSATGPAGGDKALSPGQAVTLEGKPYTVKSASPKVIRLAGPDGKVRVISSASDNWTKIEPASAAPEGSAVATTGEGNAQGQQGLKPGAPRQESTMDAAPAPTTKPTEVYAGQFGEGLAEHNAKIKAGEFAKSRPDMVWTVAETEAHSNPKYKPGRYVVEGRPKEADAAQASQAPAPRGSGETRAEGVPAAGAAPADETAGVKAKRGSKLTPHTDPRLTTDEGRQLLEGARPDIGWVQVGGQIIRDPRTAVDPDSPDAHREGDVVGRTPWVGSDLWRNRPEQGGKVTEAEAKDAIDKAVAGKPMTTRQKRFVSYVLDSEQDRERQRIEQATNPNLEDFWGMDDLADTGYTDAAEDERIATDAILADVDALGLDREAIIERAAMEAGDLTTKEYHAVLKRIADEAVEGNRRQAGATDAREAGQGTDDRGGDAQAPGRPGGNGADGSVQEVRPVDQAEGLKLASEAEAQAKADNHAKDLGGRVVWQSGDLSLIEGFSLLSGDSVFVASKGDSRTRVDIKSYTGRMFTDAEKVELLNARAEAVKADEAAQSANPEGPFAGDRVVFADDIRDDVRGVVNGWIDMLGLAGARIVVTTPASGAKMAQGLSGRFRRIGKANLSGDNTNGTMQPLGGDDFHIAIRPGVSALRTLEVLAHELGHIVERRSFSQAAPEVRTAIREAHAKWLSANGKGSALKMAMSMRAMRSGRVTGFSEGMAAEDASAYWKSFSEWFADQVSRWATTQDKPTSVVERFFKRLGAKLREFFAAHGPQFMPDSTVAGWLDSLASKTPVMTAPDEVAASSMAEAFDLQPQSEAEALAEAARRDKALADERAAQDAEQARLKREADAKEVKARADESVGAFELGQSADQQLSGQRDIFSEPAEPAQQAAAILDAAAEPPKGKERLDVLKDVKAGAITPDEVKAAYPAAEAPAADAGVQNFGEALPPGRRQLAASLSKDLTDDDIASKPLSEIWPLAENDAIEDPFAAAVAHAARAEVPAKPRKGYKLTRWVESVKAVRSLAQKIVSGAVTREKFIEDAAARSSLAGFMSKVALLEAIDRSQWKRIGAVAEYPQAVRYLDGGEQEKIPTVSVTIDDKHHWLSGSASVADHIDAINGLLGVEPQGKRMEFEVRGRGNSWAINKKGDSQYRPLMNFTSAADALKAKAEKYDELLAAWEDVKQRDNVTERDLRSTENRDRIGKDWRQGGDISAEEFGSTFGFKGGEFGKWVSQGVGAQERQWMLNRAYDALMDLAEIVGIPPRAVSLNGTLGIAFGSRGSGWASAHFEPGNLVINLTKTRGAGALAHEWFHALDNYFARMRNGGEVPMSVVKTQNGYREANYITYKPQPMMVRKDGKGSPLTEERLNEWRRQSPKSAYLSPDAWHPDPAHPNGVRPEVEERFADLVKALDESPMKARAVLIDKGKGDGYWSQVIERAARSFESYVLARMAENGHQNDYLANVTKLQDFPRDPGRYPYLTVDEVKPIAEAFGALFDTIQTRTDDAGNVALFSRADPTTGTDPATLTTWAKDTASKWANAPRISVAATAADLPADIQAALMSQGATRNARALIIPSKTDPQVWLIASNLGSIEEAQFALFHEVLGHHGLRTFLGTSYANQMALLKMANPKLKAEAQDWMRKHGGVEIQARVDRGMRMDEASREVSLLSVEEALADRAGRPQELKGWQRFMARLQAMLREKGLGAVANWLEGKTQAETLQLLADARQAVELGQGAMVAQANMVPVFSRADQTDTPEFKRWFGESRVVDAEGKPLVLYHGTKAEFTEFRRTQTGEFGPGIYATDNPREAAEYGSGKGWGGPSGTHVMPVYLSIKNPYIKGADEFWKEFGQDARPGLSIADGDAAAVARAQAAGFDGIKTTRPDRYYDNAANEYVDRGDMLTHYVAFDPTQVKSAIGNAGTFDPTNPSILLSRTADDTIGTTGEAGWSMPDGSRFDNFAYKFQDKQIDLKRAVAAIKQEAGDLADSADAYLQEELFHGRAAKQTQDFVNHELQPLLASMKLRQITQEQLNDYLHARHAPEANKLIADRNKQEGAGQMGLDGKVTESPLQDGGSGMTNAQAKAYMDGLDPAVRQRLERTAELVDAIIAKTRQTYIDYGLESKATVDGWASMFKHYVPLMREDKDGGMGIGQGFSIRGKESKHRTGSTAAVVDILANIAMQRERAIVRGEKNRVAVAMVGLAALNPNKEMWSFGPAPERRYNPKTDTVEVFTDGNWQSADNVLVAKILGRNGRIYERAVVFNERNERAARMVAALKNLDAAQLEGLIGLSAKVSRYFSAINTQWNPVFGIVNLIRDTQGAAINLLNTPLAGKKAAVMSHVASALKGTYVDARAVRKGDHPRSEWSDLWEEFQNEGGATGFRELFRTSGDRAAQIEHALDPTKWMDSPLGKVFTAGGMLKAPASKAQASAGWVFDWLSDYNLAMENAVRLSAYKVALEQGMTKQRAASLAKNLTVNFNRKGQAGQQAGALYAFFNASVQGTARMGEVLFDTKDGQGLKLTKTGAKIIAGGIMLGAIQAMVLAAAGFDDEDPPQFVRERSLIIPTGWATGRRDYISIPMPLGWNILPNIGRNAVEFALGGFKNPSKRALHLMGLFVEAFNPIGSNGSLLQTVSPTALDPLAALAENKDWTGKPIARESFNKAAPGFTLARDTASTPSRMIAEAINWMSGGTRYKAGVLSPTPDQIDYLWGQVTGGIGRELSKAEQAVMAVATGESLPPYKIPLVGRLYGNSDSSSSQGNRFYENLNQMALHEAQIKGLMRESQLADTPKEKGQVAKELEAYKQDNPEANLVEQANRYEKAVQDMRRQKRQMIERGESKERVKVVEAQITAAMKQFNDKVKAATSTSKPTAPAQQ